MAEDSIGVTLDEAIVILVSIVGTRSVHLNKFFTLIARLEFGEEKILCVVYVVKRVIWSVAQSLSSDSGVTADNMSVVAVVLGECLLKNWSPGRAVWAKLRENGVVGSIPLFGWNEVIHNDSVRNTKSVEVDSIDAVGTQLTIVFEEDILDAAWLLREGSDGRKEPAVANSSLTDIVRLDAIRSEERATSEEVTNSVPQKRIPALV